MIQKNNKKGFTLAELLIVVAIIGVLAAIAIPLFSSQLSSAQDAVNEANERTVQSMANAEYLMYVNTNGVPDASLTFYFDLDAETHAMTKVKEATGAEFTATVTPAGVITVTKN